MSAWGLGRGNALSAKLAEVEAINRDLRCRIRDTKEFLIPHSAAGNVVAGVAIKLLNGEFDEQTD